MINVISNAERTTEERSSSSDREEKENEEPKKKKICTVAVQTESRFLGKTEYEKELQRKIKVLQNRLIRRKKNISNVRDLVNHLKGASRCTNNLEEMLLTKFSKFDLALFLNEERNSSIAKNRKLYTSEMKEFASTLYFYSPRAYEFVRTKINLPHSATLRKWMGNFTIEPGFIDSVFKFLENESTSKKYLENVALIFDSMAIRKQVTLDSKAEKCRGLVDYGSVMGELKSTLDPTNVATELLAFQIVSYKDKFKCVIANFFIHGISAHVQSELLRVAIEKLYRVGVIVRSITCDCCTTNERTLELLGCNFDV